MMTDWDEERDAAANRKRFYDQAQAGAEADDPMFKALCELPDSMDNKELVMFILGVLSAYGVEGDDVYDLLGLAAANAQNIHAAIQAEEAISKLGD